MLALSMQSCTFVRFHDSQTNDKKVVVASKEKGTVSYQVADFDKVFSNLPADITYTMSAETPSVFIEGPENVLEMMNFSVVNGELMITVEDGLRYRSLSDLKIKLNSSSLESMVMEGAGEFNVPGGLESENFNLTMKGAGDVEIDGLKCGDVSVSILGAGDVEISDLDCNTVSSSIQGAGDIVLRGKAEKAVIDVAGSGEMDLRNLDVKQIEKNGNVRIKR